MTTDPRNSPGSVIRSPNVAGSRTAKPAAQLELELPHTGPRSGATMLRNHAIPTAEGVVTLTPNQSIFYSTLYGASDDWFETRNMYLKDALDDAAAWVAGNYSTWGKGVGTSSNCITCTTVDDQWHAAQQTAHSHALAMVANHFNYSTASGTGGVYVYPSSGATTITTTITTTIANSWTQYYDTTTAVSALGGPTRWTKEQHEAYKKMHRTQLLRERAAPGLRLVREKNHRGDPLRSFDSDRMFDDANREEITALHLLRGMVDHDQFRRYLKHGFIVVRGNSGMDYQIRRNSTIQVWEKGDQIADLCMHLRLERRPAPPTDHVVGKMLIVQCSEQDIWTRSRITWHTSNRDRACLQAVGHARGPGEPIILETSGRTNIINGGLNGFTVNAYQPLVAVGGP